MRIYKTIDLIDNSFDFTSKSADKSGSISQPTLKGIALRMKSEYEDLKPTTQLTIDFIPFHDVECPYGLAPHQCVPLTKKEIKEFWTHYKNLFK